MIFSACEQKKEVMLEVVDKQFTVRQFSENGWAIDAKGRIKNSGEVDAKKVVLTGSCTSCGDLWVAGKWFVSIPEEKTAEQKDVISYLAKGMEEDFNFKDVALFYAQTKEQTPEMPGQLDVIIESFEAVDK